MILSGRDTTVELNGHTVLNISEDEDAIMFPDEVEFVVTKRGMQGETARFDTATLGGEFAVKVLPNSPSIDFFIQQLKLQVFDNAKVNWEGFVRNASIGAVWRLENGVFCKGPLGQTHGKSTFKNNIFTFDFDKIIPNYDGSVLSVPSIPTTAQSLISGGAQTAGAVGNLINRLAGR